MENQQGICLQFSPEESSQILVKRRELQAMLRFINRNYVYLLCKGRMEEAAELMRMYRGLGELEFSPAIRQSGIREDVECEIS